MTKTRRRYEPRAEADAIPRSGRPGMFLKIDRALRWAMSGELRVKRQSVSGTDRGNAAARRDDQARQEQVRMRRHVARASRHRASSARDAYCNNRRQTPTFALGRS